jgi:hypothetical protein
MNHHLFVVFTSVLKPDLDPNNPILESLIVGTDYGDAFNPPFDVRQINTEVNVRTFPG